MKTRARLPLLIINKLDNMEIQYGKNKERIKVFIWERIWGRI